MKVSGLVFKALYNRFLKHVKQWGRASLLVGSFLLLFQEYGTGRDLLQSCLVPCYCKYYVIESFSSMEEAPVPNQLGFSVVLLDFAIPGEDCSRIIIAWWFSHCCCSSSSFYKFNNSISLNSCQSCKQLAVSSAVPDLGGKTARGIKVSGYTDSWEVYWGPEGAEELTYLCMSIVLMLPYWASLCEAMWVCFCFACPCCGSWDGSGAGSSSSAQCQCASVVQWN